MDYFHINTITLGIVSVALLVSVWLPMPQRGMFFQRGEGPGAAEVEVGAADPTVLMTTSRGDAGRSGGSCGSGDVIYAGRQLWRSFRESYSSRHLLYFYCYFFKYILISCNTLMQIRQFSLSVLLLFVLREGDYIFYIQCVNQTISLGPINKAIRPTIRP